MKDIEKEIKTVNLWESGFSKYFKYTNDINDLIDLIMQGENFVICDQYIPGNKINNVIDNNAYSQNIEIVYTDKNHPLAISENTFISGHMVNSIFFEEHKQEIIEAKKNYMFNVSDKYIIIDNYMYDKQLIDLIIKHSNDNTYYFKNIVLSEEEIKKLRDSHIDIYIEYNGEKKQISSKYIIERYTINSIKEVKRVSIPYNISDEELNNLGYLNDEARIIINDKEIIASLYSIGPINIDSEELYYQKVRKIVDRLNSLGKKNLITIPVYSRCLFNKIFSGLTNNCNIIIENDYYDYSYNEYITEEKRLDDLVEPIKNSNMTPFEKYLAIYDLVKNFKPYKENNEKREEARKIRYILDNEYMVCVGYVKLLKTLLEKVGIMAFEYSTSVDTSYNGGFTLEEKNVSLSGHARLLFSIDDNKYNIHGYYISDPTWDNNQDKDHYSHAIMNYDSMQFSNNMMKLNEIDLIFDVHDFSEYCNKINVLLKKLISEKKESPNYKKEIDRINNCYKDICFQIMVVLKQIDTISFNKLVSLYKETINNVSEESYKKFITEAGYIITSKVNKKISDDVIIDAVINQKKIIKKEELIDMKEQLIESKQERDIRAFPYQPNDNDWNNSRPFNK